MYVTVVDVSAYLFAVLCLRMESIDGEIGFDHVFAVGFRGDHRSNGGHFIVDLERWVSERRRLVIDVRWIVSLRCSADCDGYRRE